MIDPEGLTGAVKAGSCVMERVESPARFKTGADTSELLVQHPNIKRKVVGNQDTLIKVKCKKPGDLIEGRCGRDHSSGDAMDSSGSDVATGVDECVEFLYHG